MQTFRTTNGNLPLPVFFPDATRAVLRSLDSIDIKNTHTPGILVNTYHLYNDLGREVLKNHDGIKGFMNFQGGVISDSGGFQIGSLAKSGPGKGKITDAGVKFNLSRKKSTLFTPEDSINFQFQLMPDMMVVLDDFTPPKVTREIARDTVERTILWAKRSKDEYLRLLDQKKLDDKTRPYLLGVVQGGDFLDLRVECAQRLAEIGFDGFGYGGWPLDENGIFNFDVARTIAQNTPKNYFLYGLGIGKPDEIVALARMGYNIFDCVLPTRDARHKRLYVYDAETIDQINLEDLPAQAGKFYSYYVPDKQKHYKDTDPVSTACDCQLCTTYSRSYLAHLFRIKDMTALRLATIHNLRFYSILMEKLRAEKN